MVTISCTKIECEPKAPEQLPGVTLPCGGGADCIPSGSGGGGLETVTTSESTTVGFTGTGTTGSPLTAQVKISETPGNLLIDDDGLFVTFPEFTSYFDLAVSLTDSWAADEIIFAHVFSYESKIPANWDQAIGIIEGNTEDTTLIVELNGVAISTFEINGEIVTFPVMAEQVCSRGDVLTLRAPSVANFTYAALTLVASRMVRYV